MQFRLDYICGSKDIPFPRKRLARPIGEVFWRINRTSRRSRRMPRDGAPWCLPDASLIDGKGSLFA